MCVIAGRPQTVSPPLAHLPLLITAICTVGQSHRRALFQGIPVKDYPGNKAQVECVFQMRAQPCVAIGCLADDLSQS